MNPVQYQEIECTHCDGDMRAEYEIVKEMVGNAYMSTEWLECHVCNGEGVIKVEIDDLEDPEE